MGRANIRAKTARVAAPVAAQSSTIVNKKTIRKAKHDSLVARIEKTAPKARTSTTGGIAKSRRKKAASSSTNAALIANLESLASALPDTERSSGINFVSQSSKDHLAAGQAKRERASIKSRPGAMKRKENLVKRECERFGKNLAIIEDVARKAETGGEKKETTAAPQSSWAMLRSFISGTLEKKEEFIEKEKREAEAGMEVDA